jgi:hypothetical protein
VRRLRAWLRAAAPPWLQALAPQTATARRIMASPDRKLLVEQILPAFATLGGTMLWVGVKRYTLGYPAILQRDGAALWTSDIDPGSAAWGVKGRHVTGDLLRADQAFAPASLTAVLCNGVFGFGVDTPQSQAVALDALARIIAPGGWLLLGWNTDRTADPLLNGAFARAFEPASLQGLAARQAAPGTTHVYDIARRRA